MFEDGGDRKEQGLLMIQIEKEVNMLKQQLAEIIEREVNRIMREFLQYSYEKRYKVTIEVVLQALLGY